MAKLQLRIDEFRQLTGNDAKCLRCGAPATSTVERQFKQPPKCLRASECERGTRKWWTVSILNALQLHLIVYLLQVVGVFARKRILLPLPVCDRHRSHWLRYFVLAVVLSGLLTAYVSYVVSWIVQHHRSLLDSMYQTETLMFLALGFLALSLTSHLVLATRIRATEVTESTITLKGVARSHPCVEAKLAAERDYRSAATDGSFECPRCGSRIPAGTQACDSCDWSCAESEEVSN